MDEDTRLSRRKLIAEVGSSAFLGITGCLQGGSDGDGGDGNGGNGLEYQTYVFDSVTDEPLIEGGVMYPQNDSEPKRYATLVTNEDDVKRFNTSILKQESGGKPFEFVDSTDFSESYLLVIQVYPMSSIPDFEVKDVSQEGEVLKVRMERYSESGTDDITIETIFVRVHDEPPKSAEISAKDFDNEFTFSTSVGDGLDFTYSFEEGISGWGMDSDVPEDPNNPGNPVEWSIETSNERAVSGSTSLRYFLDGRQDDGTIWVVRPLKVESGQRYRADVKAKAWSETESFNTLAYLVMFLGTRSPSKEESFPGPNETWTEGEAGGLRHTLNQKEGWTEYSFTWNTPQLSTDTVYLAVGVSVVWETEITYFVDDVEVNFERV